MSSFFLFTHIRFDVCAQSWKLEKKQLNFTDRKNEKLQIKSPVIDELASDKENVKKGEEANKKPLIEILETYQDKLEKHKIDGDTKSEEPKIIELTNNNNKQDEEIVQKSDNNDYQQPEGIVREGDTIIDHDKKLLRYLSNESNTDNTSQQNNKSNENKKDENLEKPMKKINILEVKATDSKSIKTNQVCIKETSKTIPKDNKDNEQKTKNITVTEIPKTRDESENKVKSEKGKDEGKETKKEENYSSQGNDTASASRSHGSGDSKQSSER